MQCVQRCSLFSRLTRPVLERRFLARDSTKPTPSEEYLAQQGRIKEPRLTRGEVIGGATVDPQHYQTSYQDNFQKTTIDMDVDSFRETRRNYIYSYNEAGFRMADKRILLGPVAVFPKTVLSWMVMNADEITEESLLLFTMLEPKLDLLIVGVGERENIRPVQTRLQPFFRRHNLTVEFLDTPEACSTFNFMNKERRYVAAVLMPMRHVEPSRGAANVTPLENEGVLQTDIFGLSSVPGENITEMLKGQYGGLIKKARDKAKPSFEADVDAVGKKKMQEDETK